MALQREIKLKFDALYRSEQRNGGSPAQVMSFQKKLTSRWWGWWCGKCEFRNGRIILFQDWHSVEFLLNCLVLMNNQNCFFLCSRRSQNGFRMLAICRYYIFWVHSFDTTSVTRCWIKKIAQMFSKVALIISIAVFILIDRFQKSPKVNNIFGYFWVWICCQELLKIVQSGHTGHD